MSLQTRLAELITAVGTDISNLLTTRGTMASLTTTEKTNLVGALNELKAELGTLAEGSGAINDAATSTETTWSSSKIDTSITAAIAALVDGAPGALDTLAELATELNDQDSVAAALTTAVGNRLRFDAAQTLDSTQKAQGNTNLGSLSLVQSGDPETDLAALYTAAKA
ncbi:MAG: hypothetical protein ACREO4_06235 [Lysobacter sp.]